MLDCLKEEFPKFWERINNGEIEVNSFRPPYTADQIKHYDERFPLPDSYKKFLACLTDLVLDEPWVTLRGTFSFDDPRYEDVVCFGEYFREADGDNVMFDLSQGLINGEYPVYYYAHDFANDPDRGLRKLADSFREWIENLTAPINIDDIDDDEDEN